MTATVTVIDPTRTSSAVVAMWASPACRMLGISKPTLLRAIHRGDVAAVCVGGRYAVPVRTIQEIRYAGGWRSLGFRPGPKSEVQR